MDMKQVINDLKKRGLMNINQGKKHLESDGYSMLANKLMQQKPDSGQSWSTVIFAWSCCDVEPNE